MLCSPHSSAVPDHLQYNNSTDIPHQLVHYCLQTHSIFFFFTTSPRSSHCCLTISYCVRKHNFHRVKYNIENSICSSRSSSAFFCFHSFIYSFIRHLAFVILLLWVCHPFRCFQGDTRFFPCVSLCGYFCILSASLRRMLVGKDIVVASAHWACSNFFSLLIIVSCCAITSLSADRISASSQTKGWQSHMVTWSACVSPLSCPHLNRTSASEGVLFDGCGWREFSFYKLALLIVFVS